MSNELVAKPEISIIEQIVVQGDLSKLNAPQRVEYYKKVCESCGLNPFTRPFDYIILNGKMTLYAKKDCTDQLRKINSISIMGLETEIVDDLYVVKAKAVDPSGRVDESTGAVVIGNLKGEQKANAIMKAETKAKRRVTLSICGLGWVDESEIDSIPSAKKVIVDMETGEIKGPSIEFINHDQVEELQGLLSKCDRDFQDRVWKKLDKQGINRYEDIPKETFFGIKMCCEDNIKQKASDET